MSYKVLNLYAGIGGNRKLWDNCEVTAIELNPEIAKIYQDFYPNDKVIVTDAHQYLLDHFKEFDFIWSSPPCQSHTVLNTMLNKNGINRYPDMTLYQQIIFLKHWFYGKYVIENVKPYYNPLINPDTKLDRHYFWTNVKIFSSEIKDKRQVHTSINNSSNVYNYDLSMYNIKNKSQLLKNMVNPEIGLKYLNRARNIQIEENTPQTKIKFK